MKLARSAARREDASGDRSSSERAPWRRLLVWAPFSTILGCGSPAIRSQHAPACVVEATVASVTGAYFRKVESQPRVDVHGIRATIRLPRITFDPTREFVSPEGEGDYRTGPLDRPSVYVGGNAAGHEVDVGLTWDRVYDSHAAPQSEFAFRPYWRTTNAKNEWHQPRVGALDNVYFRPAETITMTLVDAGRDTLRLEIVGGRVHFSQTFEQRGFGVGAAQSFKRVSSIDQFTLDANGKRIGLEGRDVLPTRTRATGAAWIVVDLLDASGSPIAALACGNAVEVRGKDTRARYDAIFVRSALDSHGGESLDIIPSP